MHDFRSVPVPRAVRMGEEIQKIMGDIFQHQVQIAKAGLLTVTGVKMSSDLRVAHVSISLLQPERTPEAVLTELKKRRKEVRFHLGNELQVKYIPDVRFHIDESMDTSARIDAILEDIHKDKESRS